jgi:hypothetical protein
MDRCELSSCTQWGIQAMTWLGGLGGQGGWGDGPRPFGVPTGLSCQGAAAAFIVAIAPLSTFTIAACRLSDMEHTSCLYWHSEHRPRRPKLTQAPSFPTFSWPNLTLPHEQSSRMVMDGWSLLNAATTFWHRGGIEALMVGCGPAVCTARGVAGVLAPGTFDRAPTKCALGHVSVSWTEQSSTSSQTVLSKFEWGSRSPSSHPLQARKNC